jgi:hypothetical protein
MIPVKLAAMGHESGRKGASGQGAVNVGGSF